MVVFVFLLETGEVGQSVVGDPEPVGEAVCQDDVHGVVAPGQQEEHHAGDAGEEGDPVDRVVPLWCVCKEERVSPGRY